MTALIDVARDLIIQRQFDGERVLMLLSKLPTDELSNQARDAVKHAQMTSAAALKGGSGDIVAARFALARVVGLISPTISA